MQPASAWVRKSTVAKVQFGRDWGEIDVPGGTSLLAAAGRAGAPLGQSCRGQGVCNSCRVLVKTGESALDEATQLETRWKLPSGSRLACQARVRVDAATKVIIALSCAAWGGAPRVDAGETP
jgi:ferredoxin